MRRPSGEKRGCASYIIPFVSCVAVPPASFDGAYHKANLTRPPLYFADVEPEIAYPIETSTRIGLTRGVELPYRFFVADSPYVSPGTPSDLAVARRKKKPRRSF